MGVILYGPPAAGKDTIERALTKLSDRFQHYARIKVGSGRREGYRLTSAEELDQLRVAGHVIWENRAYGAVYAIDGPSLRSALADGSPVVHVGQPAAVEAIQRAAGPAWVVVDLWCPRETTAERLTGRGAKDVQERLRVWDNTPRLLGADLAINTGRFAPETAAALIAMAVRGA
ncbi:hypothetical protein L1785_14530 [Antribacter sp. KLBMP9083]|uniref:Guanylate kinase n=1 Tax=Antribacter soli TaxID=2910976 RepID=A0AA41QEX8_9MICO|nr:hypothetical protein [Antribacter soli]MCF4122193.1 hypothetical protein [Antribacter soli]